MRKIIGIGETVFDIIFKNNQPISAKPGGSIYNALISLGRLKLPAVFISETGEDCVGNIIKNFLEENGVSSQYIYTFDRGKTPLALAFLDEQQKADYLFYQEYPDKRLDYTMPEINENDIVLIGSYFALNPVLRNNLLEILQFAQARKAIIYYDVNFRKAHIHEVRHLMPALLENFEFADIIKGSDEDFEHIYNEQDACLTYREHIEFYCKNFICTQGEKGATVFGKNFHKKYPVNPIVPVSTVGAGDSFNAGIIFGLIKHRIILDDLKTGIPEEKWDNIVKCAIDFSAFVCTTYDNYISTEFARDYLERES
ncbi:MAG: carbohydrate kinase [Prevotellaceae bacterium]|jgi:fructokinase|nr:carbohydrate kinase [Prevotellaceae bacterium]